MRLTQLFSQQILLSAQVEVDVGQVASLEVHDRATGHRLRDTAISTCHARGLLGGGVTLATSVAQGACVVSGALLQGDLTATAICLRTSSRSTRGLLKAKQV